LKFVNASKLVDEVELDVVSLDICGIILGSPYLYDWNFIFFRRENKYHLTQGGVEYIVRAHSMRNLTLVSAGQIKRAINTSKKFVLMVLKEKDIDKSNVFNDCDPSHKEEMIDVIYNYDEFFPEPKGFPPKREIQHKIQLHQDVSLPNLACKGCMRSRMRRGRSRCRTFLKEGSSN